MKKTIKLNSKEKIKIDTSWNWAYIYMDYFGHDIIPDLVPIIDTFIDTFTGLLNGAETDEDEISDKLYGLESTTLSNVIWALAKNADDGIPDVREWYKGFDRFPLDVILPEVLETLADTMMSSKKAELLRETLTALASQFIQSASQRSIEA